MLEAIKKNVNKWTIKKSFGGSGSRSSELFKYKRKWDSKDCLLPYDVATETFLYIPGQGECIEFI